MVTHAFSIRATTEADWQEIRDLRIEMLRDTPTAYSETLDAALSHDEEQWRARGRRGTAEHQMWVAAITPTGRWVGMMGGRVPESADGPELVGVYVAPDLRGGGHGVTDALLATIETWARTESDRLTLHVHEDNARARRAYARRGFVLTGVTVPYSLDPTANELEMVKEL